MKKIIISLFAISALLFTGCFVNSDTATVRINLGNLPVAKVEKKSLMDRFLLIFAKEAVAGWQVGNSNIIAVHLGAFDANNKLLAKRSLNIENMTIEEDISFEVPAASRVKIVVLGEASGYDSPEYIAYYGISDPLDLSAGATERVPINMEQLNDSYINLPSSPSMIVEWNKVTGASLYKIYVSPEPQLYDLIHSTESTYFESEETNAVYYLRVEFGFAGKYSNYLEFFMNGI